MKRFHVFTLFSIAIGIFLWPLVAFAQVAGTPDPGNLTSFAQTAFSAVTSHNWALVASLAVIAVVYVLRKFAGPKLKWITTDRGGAFLVIVVSVAGALANALLAGAHVGWGVLLTALQVGLGAAGGWAVVRKLLGISVPAPAPAPVVVPKAG